MNPIRFRIGDEEELRIIDVEGKPIRALGRKNIEALLVWVLDLGDAHLEFDEFEFSKPAEGKATTVLALTVTHGSYPVKGEGLLRITRKTTVNVDRLKGKGLGRGLSAVGYRNALYACKVITAAARPGLRMQYRTASKAFDKGDDIVKTLREYRFEVCQ